LLIEKGADVNKQDIDKETRLSICLKNSNCDIIYRTTNSFFSQDIAKIEIEYLEMAHLLIGNGENVNLFDKDGNNALIIAIQGHKPTA